MHANTAFRLLAMRPRNRAVFLIIELINPEEQWRKAQFQLLIRGFQLLRRPRLYLSLWRLFLWFPVVSCIYDRWV